MKTRSFATLCAFIGLLSLALLPGETTQIVSAQTAVLHAAIPHSAFHIPRSTAPGDWPMYGHDISRTNFNPDETIISRDNVNDLVQRWQANTGTGNVVTSGGPSVANGRVFVGSTVATGNNFFAFDAVTGKPAWNQFVGYLTGCLLSGVPSTSAIDGGVVSVGVGTPLIMAWMSIRVKYFGDIP